MGEISSDAFSVGRAVDAEDDTDENLSAEVDKRFGSFVSRRKEARMGLRYGNDDAGSASARVD